MRRLLKIREFFHLQKEDEVEDSDCQRPAKRPRKDTKAEDGGASPEPAGLTSNNACDPGYERFLKVFENETAKECVWWLPGRRGEAFAIHKERFEHSLLKIHLEQHCFSEFLGKLKQWGFRQMNIPSLSGRIVAFEKGSQHAICRDVARGHLEAQEGYQRRQPGHLQSQGTTDNRFQFSEGNNQGERSDASINLSSLSSSQLQQAQYLLQQEVSQTYFVLLWQELQRQLSVLLVQQSQTATNEPNSSQQSAGSPAGPSSGSEILDVATLLHQQQLQQQVVAAQFIRSVISEPPTRVDQQALLREINGLHQQQLSNLTYQIVALVAANLEHQNQNPAIPEAPVVHRVLVKYMIVLVLLQLQQQQYNLEFLRQERTAALALLRSSDGADEDTSEDTASDHINTIQMQQLLAEAAMLSLSRAHQLLCEASLLVPPAEPGSPAQEPQLGALHGSSLSQTTPPPFAGAGLSHGTPPPRVTPA